MEQDKDLAATAMGVASSRKGVGASMPEVQIHQPDLMGPPPGDNAIDADSWEQPIWAEDGESLRADHEKLGRRHARHQLAKHLGKRSTFDFLPVSVQRAKKKRIRGTGVPLRRSMWRQGWPLRYCPFCALFQIQIGSAAAGQT